METSAIRLTEPTVAVTIGPQTAITIKGRRIENPTDGSMTLGSKPGWELEDVWVESLDGSETVNVTVIR
jgi:hypothetical protein